MKKIHSEEQKSTHLFPRGRKNDDGKTRKMHLASGKIKKYIENSAPGEKLVATRRGAEKSKKVKGENLNDE